MKRSLAFLGTLLVPLVAIAQAANDPTARTAPPAGTASGSSGAWGWIIAIIVVLAIIWWAAGSRRRSPPVRP
jgi:hypothetical protein